MKDTAVPDLVIPLEIARTINREKLVAETIGALVANPEHLAEVAPEDFELPNLKTGSTIVALLKERCEREALTSALAEGVTIDFLTRLHASNGSAISAVERTWISDCLLDAMAARTPFIASALEQLRELRVRDLKRRQRDEELIAVTRLKNALQDDCRELIERYSRELIEFWNRREHTQQHILQGLQATVAAVVTEEPIRWLWPRWIPLGVLLLVYGDGGIGKTYMILDIMARLSSGSDFPGEDAGMTREPLNCLLVSAEDSKARTLKRRLRALGADMNKVHLFGPSDGVGRGDYEEPLDLTKHVSELEAYMKCHGIRFVFLDPISTFLSGCEDLYNDAIVRKALAPLARVAERLDATIGYALHTPKADPRKALNSVAFRNASRSAIYVQAEQGGIRRVRSDKLNDSEAPTDLSFRFERAQGADKDDPPLIAWSAADPIREAEPKTTKKESAKALLMARLASGNQPCKTVKDAALAGGISESTLQDAKRELGVREDGGYWSLPDGGMDVPAAAAGAADSSGVQSAASIERLHPASSLESGEDDSADPIGERPSDGEADPPESPCSEEAVEIPPPAATPSAGPFVPRHEDIIPPRSSSPRPRRERV